MTPIHDLDERRRAALAEVDNASFSVYHVKVALVAGVGFFTDAYDIFAINIASTMLAYVYSPQNENTLPFKYDLGVKIATPVGTLIGQLIFGWLADIVGRKRMYGVELLTIIVGCFAQTLAGEARAVNVIDVIIVWRVVMGIGIGGDYPLSAVISSEFSSTKFRGRLMTMVFSAQGWGTLTSVIVALILVTAYKPSLDVSKIDSNTLDNIDVIWRMLIGIGCVPACIALYFRLTIPETPRFTMDIERNVQRAAQDVRDYLTSGTFVVDPDAVVQRVQVPQASRNDFLKYFSKRENLKVLIGTTWSWFALDVVFYGLALNSSAIFTAIKLPFPDDSDSESPFETLKNICISNIILSAAGLIPGYYMTFLLIDSWGRKSIQLMGFTLLTLLFLIMGFAYEGLIKTTPGKKAFVFLFCLADFFQTFGPNTTTFIIPGEIFPTRYRSTAHGISAASGKLGAIVMQVAFASLQNNAEKSNTTDQENWPFLGTILDIFAIFMVTGVFSTLLIPETKNRTLEDLSNESQEGFVEGVATHVETQEGLIVGNTALTP
ncbi:phosphate permease [Schizopora paradoxa]|uniref:Phosphate permease n=1 Tax=Schizopora paradoxa TaxID=27342 RepID=A0A0H2R6N9_9AGAM|nr:phosphate permease [Schizopora paradoxa]